MSGNIKSFLGCPVMVYNDENELIIESAITDHNRTYNTIVISDELRGLENGTPLNLLIIHSAGAAEFRGTLRSLINNAQEIALYNERQREARGSQRHKLNVPAKINCRIIKTGREPFTPPLEIVIDNISISGVLIKSDKKSIELGSIFEIHANIHGKDAILYTSVVREDVNADNTYSFGCRFHFLDR